MYLKVNLVNIIIAEKGGCVTFFNFLLNMTSWACLLRSGLKVIFHWKAQSLIFFRLLFNSIADAFISCTTENREVSLANSLAFDDKPIKPEVEVEVCTLRPFNGIFQDNFNQSITDFQNLQNTKLLIAYRTTYWLQDSQHMA